MVFKEPEQKSNPTGIKFASKGELVQHRGIAEELTINKYHLIWVISRLQGGPRRPRLEHVVIPLALFLGLLLALLPADFQNYIGLNAEIWEAIAIILTTVSGIATITLFIWWIINITRNPPKTPEECYDEIIKQMTQDRERLAGTRVTQTQEPHKKGS